MKVNVLTKTRDLIQREKRPAFYKELDLYEVRDAVVVGVTGVLGQGYKLQSQDVLSKPMHEIEDFEKRMRKFLNSLPEGVTLHFVVRSKDGDDEVLKEYEDSIRVNTDLNRRFVEAKIASYRAQPFLKREVFLFVVINPEQRKKSSVLGGNFSLAFGKKARKVSAREYQKNKNRLLAVTGEVEEGLRELGFLVMPLSERGMLRYLYEVLNSDDSADVSPFKESFVKGEEECVDPSSLRSQLLFSTPYVGYEYFYLGRLFYQALNVIQLPERTTIQSIRDFEDALGKEYCLSLTIQTPDQDREKEAIKLQRNLASSKDVYSKTKDYDAIVKEGETDHLLTHLAESEDKLFYVSFSVLVKGKTKDELERVTRDALRGFRRLGDGCRAIRDHMNHDRLFISSLLPLQGDENPLSFLVRSEALVHLLPLQASWSGTAEIGLLLKTKRHEALRLDPFSTSLSAPHGVVLGATGSGKSFLVNHKLMSFYAQSPLHDIVVLDLGGSYKKLARVLGSDASYMEVECSEEFSLNPFPEKRMLFGENGQADATLLEFLKELLQKMINPRRMWSASEKVILESAVKAVYQRLKDSDAPLLGDVQKFLREYPLGDDEDKRLAYGFSKELILFCEGEFSKVLNRPARFSFDKRFTVIDLRKISQYRELQEILLLIIPFAIKRKFESVGRKKMLVLDECWHLLKQTQGLDLIELFYRTMRKMGGGVIAITQSPEDFLSSEIAPVILNNSSTMDILKLKKGTEKLVQFGLNENQIKQVESLEVRPGRYSQILVVCGNQSAVVQFETSPLEYWISTTHPLDLREEDALRKEMPELSTLEILERLAKKYPRGVTQLNEGAGAHDDIVQKAA